MSYIEALSGVDAASYQRHGLHSESAIWLEKNCYVDVWIELLHTLSLEPMAMLPFTLAVDFEGDQWTFFKPSLEELRTLYGIDVQELTIWRPLIEHAEEHLAAGKLISTEADAFWLPDTSGTDYRLKHSKTTVVLSALDRSARRLGYFHNAGYFELGGEDFTQFFRLDAEPDPNHLPLYAELLRFDSLVRRPRADLLACSWSLLQRHLGRRPLSNPLRRFGERFERDLPVLQDRGLPHYHAWAFSAIRQAGSAYDLAAAYLRWQAEYGYPELLAPAGRFETIAQGNKALILKGARAVNARRPFDATPLFSEMTQAWDDAMHLLQDCVDQPAWTHPKTALNPSLVLN